MTETPVFLKANVLAEPLINQWYAWACTFAPASGALYLANSQLKMMRAFISAPLVHINALKNPAMLGGPFIDYGKDRVDELKALIDKIEQVNKPQLALAEAIGELNKMLLSKAQGFSVAPLYERVPDPLKGYVEIVYDLNNQPSARFLEGLLYQSPYYNEQNQMMALSLLDKDERSYVLSTPRLIEDHQLRLKLPFRDKSYDDLFRTAAEGCNLDQIAALCQIANADRPLFDSFFTSQTPKQRLTYEGKAVRIRFFGHACILIEAGGTSILVDPIFSNEPEGGIPRYSYQDLPETVNYLVITHTHGDHCMFETLLRLRHRVEHVVVPANNSGSLADPSLKAMFTMLGFSQVSALDVYEQVLVEGGSITSMPFIGEHGDLDIRSKSAYLIRLGGKQVMLVADSNNQSPEMYEHVHKHIGDIDVLFLGMECAGAPLSWPYGPFLPKMLPRKMDQSRRIDGSNHERGIKMIECLKPKQVYIYAMAAETWMTFISSVPYSETSLPHTESEKLIVDCRKRGLIAERLKDKAEFIMH